MNKKIDFILIAIIFSLLIINLNFVIAEDTATADSSNVAVSGESGGSSNVISETTTSTSTETSEPVASEINSETTTEEKPEFNVEPGMTPDNPLYIIKDTYQRIAVGNNPEKALGYREQKIAEAQVMIEEGKIEEAGKVLDRALEYGDIIVREVSPNIQEDVQRSSYIVQNVLEDLKNNVEDSQIQEKFDENIEKEKKIGSAAELVSKISELCDALVKLDPLQYADTCKSKGDSPKWQKERDKELTKEQEAQAKVFVEKLSQCFENPKECDCKGIGVQKFEEFCLEKSSLAIKCQEGDKNSCKKLENGADPTELLPDYLASSFKNLESRYMKAEMDMYMPEECQKAKVKTPEDCSKIMFKLNSPEECINAGLTGKSMQDEEKCKALMFEKNAPKECIDVGISEKDSDAPRKCAALMFKQRAPQSCIDAGITGERRDDEKRCRELMMSSGGEFGKKPISEGGAQQYYKPKFSKNCNALTDSAEKIKCYEEFYNNAQVQFSDDFVQREFAVDQNTGETITSDEESARKACRDKGMNTILEYENGKRVIICVDKNYQGSQQGQKCPDGICDSFEKTNPNACPQDCGGSNCQSQQQIDNLKKDCVSRGQSSVVENRNGCPWVICIGADYQGLQTIQGQQTGQVGQAGQVGQQNYQQTQTGGQKCPDGICDSYERMNPYACPEDCGGQRMEQNTQQYPQPSSQGGGNVCAGQAPSCAPNGDPYCDNGNWNCHVQQPTPQQEPQPPPTPPPEPAPEPAPAPLTGGTIAIDGEFWSYWYK